MFCTQVGHVYNVYCGLGMSVVYIRRSWALTSLLTITMTSRNYRRTLPACTCSLNFCFLSDFYKVNSTVWWHGVKLMGVISYNY